MKRTIRILLAVTTLIASLGAAASVLVGISEARSSGERLAGAEYSVLRNSLSGALDPGYLADPFLRERLLSLYKSSGRLLAVQVLDEGGLSVWRLPGDSHHFAPAGSKTARGGFIAPAFSTSIHSTPLSGGMKLSALYATLLRSDISKAAKTAGFVLGLWLIAAGVLALMLSREKTAAQYPEPMPVVEPGDIIIEDMGERAAPEPEGIAPPTGEPGIESGSSQPAIVAGDDDELPDFSLPEENGETSSSPGMEETDDRAGAQASTVETPTPTESEISEDLADLADLADLEAEEIAEADVFQEEGEAASSMPVSGTPPEPGPSAASVSGPVMASALESAAAAAAESHGAPSRQGSGIPEWSLESKLEEELARKDIADLALILVRCATTGPNDPAIPALAASVKDYFSIRDLVFERGSGDFALVLPGLDVGRALRMSEDLADVLAATLSLYRDIEGPPPVFAGMSSVAGRNGMTPLRLYKESMSALNKACTGRPARILAFRPDPRRYAELAQG